MVEMALALSEKKKGSAPGPDLITYEMLKRSHPNMKTHINRLFNELLNAGYYPKAWRTATVVALPKPGKPAKNPSSYRPIALTSQLGKTFETVLKKRLTHFCEKKQILPPEQSGFRKKRSTLDHLTTLAQTINNYHKVKNTDICGIFLDIEKAYDMLWREGLLAKLTILKVPHIFVKVIESFLMERKMKVRVDKILSEEKTLDNGVPQGSVLSPLLFNIMIADLVKTVKRNKVMQFADDTSIIGKVEYRRKPNRKWKITGFEDLQKDLDALALWFQSMGFKLSTAKTQVILFRDSSFRNRPSMEELPQLVLNGTPLEYADKVKFLGVYFQKNNSLAP